MTDHRQQGRLIADSRRGGLVVSGVVLVALLLAWWQAGEWYETYLLTEARADVQRHLIPYGTALTTGINQRFAQLEGLAAFARSHPSINDLDASFTAFAEGLYTGKEGIRTIQFFPKDGYVYVYPISGNEAVVGRTLDDLINDERPNVRADVQRAIETRQITTSGPYELRQGGLGLLARLAVYQDDTLWGIAVIVLDMPPLLSEAGLDTPPEDSELAIRDSAEQVFVGQDSVFAAEPALYQVDLPEGAWVLAMIPAGGWHAEIRDQLYFFRLGGLVIVGLAFSLIYIATTRQARLADSVQARTAALTESQERYRTLFESNTDSVFVLNAQGRIVDVNQSACHCYGYERAELLTMTPSDLATPDLRDKVSERIADALSGQTQFEWRHQRKDGTEFPVEISAQSFVLANQPYVLSSVRDISERKRAEEALHESRERYHSVISNLPNGLIHIFDRDLRYVFNDGEGMRRLGLTNEMLVGKTIHDVLEPDTATMVEEHYRRVLAGETVKFEGFFADQAFLVSAAPLRDSNGEIHQILALSIDITDRKHAEEALKLSETRLRVSTEMAGVAVWEYDMIANQMARSANHDQLYGLEQQEVWVIDTFLAATHPDDRERSGQIIQGAVAPGGPDHYEFDFRVIWSDQSVHWLAVTGEIVRRDANGAGELVHGCLIDITDRKRVSEALRESEERYRLLVQQSPYAIGVHQDGVLVFANPAAVRLLGAASADELVGKAISDIIHPDGLAVAGDRISRMLQGETGLYPVEDRYVRLDGSAIAVEVTAAPFTFRGRPAVQVIALDITGRKQAEEALRVSEAKYRGVVEQSITGIYIFAADRFLYVNDRFAEMFGYSKEEILRDLKPTDVVAGPDKPVALENVRRRLEGETDSVHYSVQGIKKDGTLLWIEIHGTQAVIDGEAVVTGTVLDITEREQAEEELRLSEKLFSDAFHVGPAGMTVTRIADGKFIDANESFCEMFEFNRDEVIGHTSTELNMWTPEERGKLIQQQLETGGLHNFELVAQAKSGRIIDVLFSSREMQIKGEACHLTTMIDITERKRAEKDRIESEKRYRALFENMNAGFVLFEVVQDDQGVPVDLIILAANKGFEHTTGLKAQEAIGKRLTKVLPGIENDAADWIGMYGKTALTGESQQFEQGSELLGYYYSVAAFQSGPKICAVTFVDITERRRAEVAIRKLNVELEHRIAERTGQLEAKTRELETFNYSVSHDLKAPLRGIDGYSRLLLEDYIDQLDDDGRIFLRNIRYATNQMSQLIDDMLIYSRLERRELSAAQINPQVVLQTLIAEFDDQIQAQGVSVTLDVPCRTLSTDPEGLSMALRNLIENALKFTRDTINPQIEIGGRDTESSCMIWVRDNGIGFDMQYHDRIFEIFQRLHRAEDYEGTGVGLAIVKKAVERLKGRIWAESEPGRGATFYLEIPK